MPLAETSAMSVYSADKKRLMYTNPGQCVHTLAIIDIHESHYLRFARLYISYNQNVDKSHVRANYSLMEYKIT